ncbi:MAG TPA: 4,5-DOPA dioxygenase extradiol, partial [Shewanella sp.]|nr:4,5-DOPA dioxygenase extradiol [Shewanella sp.]
MSATQIMPALFLGHGSPMNALQNNTTTKQWQKLGQTL